MSLVTIPMTQQEQAEIVAAVQSCGELDARIATSSLLANLQEAVDQRDELADDLDATFEAGRRVSSQLAFTLRVADVAARYAYEQKARADQAEDKAAWLGEKAVSRDRDASYWESEAGHEKARADEAEGNLAFWHDKAVEYGRRWRDVVDEANEATERIAYLKERLGYWANQADKARTELKAVESAGSLTAEDGFTDKALLAAAEALWTVAGSAPVYFAIERELRARKIARPWEEHDGGQV